MNIQKTIKELIQFYVQTNYNKYLKDHNISFIPENQLSRVINEFYDGKQRKTHIKSFVINSIKTLAENNNETLNYNNIQLMMDEILEDDELAKSRVTQEILIYQKQKIG